MPTKILHLTYDMAIGGTEQVIFQLVTGLSDDNYCCSIACLEPNLGSFGVSLREQGIETHILQRNPGFDIKLIWNIRSILRDKDIDIIHCHQYTPFVYGVLAAALSGTKVVFTEHGRFYPDRYSWKRRLLNPLLARFTHSITAISAATADALSYYEWFDRKVVQVVYNGLAQSAPRDRTETRRKIGAGSESVVFGTITRFDPIKNLPLLVDAFDIVRKTNPDIKLLLVGDGGERDKIQEMVDKAGLGDLVVFTGYQQDTVAYMSAIDVFVLCSLSEGTSMTLLEAMSLDVCCLVTDVGGNAEIVDHDSSGYVVPSDNVHKLAVSMTLLASDSDLRSRLGRSGKSVFQKKFELGKMVDKYSQIYNEITR